MGALQLARVHLTILHRRVSINTFLPHLKASAQHSMRTHSNRQFVSRHYGQYHNISHISGNTLPIRHTGVRYASTPVIIRGDFRYLVHNIIRLFGFLYRSYVLLLLIIIIITIIISEYHMPGGHLNKRFMGHFDCLSIVRRCVVRAKLRRHFRDLLDNTGVAVGGGVLLVTIAVGVHSHTANAHLFSVPRCASFFS